MKQTHQAKSISSNPRVAMTPQPAFGRYSQYTLERVRVFGERLQSLIYCDRLKPELIKVAGPTDRISYDQAQDLDYRDTALGAEFGPLWSTYWFKLQFDLSDRWASRRVDLHWNSHSEALLFINGQATQGLNPSKPFHMGRHDAMVYKSAPPGGKVELDIEMACNGLFGLDTPPGKAEPAKTHERPAHWLEACELRLFDPVAWEIAQDYSVLSQLLMDSFPEQEATGQSPKPNDTDPTWAGHLLHELNRFCNAFDPDQPSTWDEAHTVLKKLLAAKNGTHGHRMSVIGHAHIDTAWLWPVDETHRKCRRTFSSVLRYMEQYPEFQFACSQAYQYDAISELDEPLFLRILEKIESGQWLPVGGSWVEPDCNLPSGESLCRQFLYGQRYFERVFGKRQSVFWNPDVFGYNGQLPQIMQQAGLTRFLTQKLSWNKFTSPMHHTFYWRGLDGSSVLAHFPPADTYNGDCSIKQLRHHANNYKDYDRSSDAYYLFGYGDGGGGPSPKMIEAIRRVSDLQGVPRAEYRSPDAFFDRLEQCTSEMPVQTGELYLELHRGTFTSQALTKRLNAEAERKLHDAEFLIVKAYPNGVPDSIKSSLEAAWKLVLLNQFHDILPGSSIGEVYDRANRELQEACDTADQVSTEAIDQLAGEGNAAAPINTIGIAREQVVETPDGASAVVNAPAFGIGRLVATDHSVSLASSGQGFTLDNTFITATLSNNGELVGLICKATGQELLAGSGNRLVLYDDHPNMWDAWDIDPQTLEAPRPVDSPAEVEVVQEDALRVAIRFSRRLGSASRITQTISLDALSPYLSFDNEVDWQETNTLLKAEFSPDVLSEYATYECQFGSVARPTHCNTQADTARYECPGQRWVDLSDAGSGLSLITDCKYGYAVRDNLMSISLLRSSTYPDPEQDKGTHHFRYAVYPHAGGWREARTYAWAKRFAHPLRWVPSSQPPEQTTPWVRCENDQVVIDTIKPAEDGKDVVIRLYEAVGARCNTALVVDKTIKHAYLSNTLEDKVSQVPFEPHRLEIQLRPYQLLTLRLGLRHES
ncbi:MAG: glycoside hydrolase family 38 C-terminal domain-containing protein [Planctomycetota bacterium]